MEGKGADCGVARCGRDSEKRRYEEVADGSVQGLARWSDVQCCRGAVHALSATAEGAGG